MALFKKIARTVLKAWMFFSVLISFFIFAIIATTLLEKGTVTIVVEGGGIALAYAILFLGLGLVAVYLLKSFDK